MNAEMIHGGHELNCRPGACMSCGVCNNSSSENAESDTQVHHSSELSRLLSCKMPSMS